MIASIRKKSLRLPLSADFRAMGFVWCPAEVLEGCCRELHERETLTTSELCVAVDRGRDTVGPLLKDKRVAHLFREEPRWRKDSRWSLDAKGVAAIAPAKQPRAVLGRMPAKAHFLDRGFTDLQADLAFKILAELNANVGAKDGGLGVDALEKALGRERDDRRGDAVVKIVLQKLDFWKLIERTPRYVLRANRDGKKRAPHRTTDHITIDAANCEKLVRDKPAKITAPMGDHSPDFVAARDRVDWDAFVRGRECKRLVDVVGPARTISGVAWARAANVQYPATFYKCVRQLQKVGIYDWGKGAGRGNRRGAERRCKIKGFSRLPQLANGQPPVPGDPVKRIRLGDRAIAWDVFDDDLFAAAERFDYVRAKLDTPEQGVAILNVCAYSVSHNGIVNYRRMADEVGCHWKAVEQAVAMGDKVGLLKKASKPVCTKATNGRPGGVAGVGVSVFTEQIAACAGSPPEAARNRKTKRGTKGDATVTPGIAEQPVEHRKSQTANAAVLKEPIVVETPTQCDWSDFRSPDDWVKVFHRSWSAISRRIRDGKSKAEKQPGKWLYRFPVSELPASVSGPNRPR